MAVEWFLDGLWLLRLFSRSFLNYLRDRLGLLLLGVLVLLELLRVLRRGSFFLLFFAVSRRNFGLLLDNNLWLDVPKLFRVKVEVFNHVDAVVCKLILLLPLGKIGLVGVREEMDRGVVNVLRELMLDDPHRVLPLDPPSLLG